MNKITWRKRILLLCVSVLLVVCVVGVVPIEASAASTIDIQVQIDKCIEKKNLAHEMAECARKLGYPESHVVIQTAKSEWNAQDKTQKDLKKQLTAQQAKTDQRLKEYQYATLVYEGLRKRGLNDAVTCGIIGNMMRETGGNTLKINPYIYSVWGDYYGLCQWSMYYYPEMRGASIDKQLDYIIKTMPAQFKMFGANYEYFKAMSSPEQAAIYFSTYYERGGFHSMAANNARVAYNYFCG